MSWHWPFNRTVHVRMLDLEDRMTNVEHNSQTKANEAQAIELRLRYLEIQAEVLARQHLKEFDRRADDRRHPA